MNNRERFLKTMRWEPVDHPPLVIGGPWGATRERWEKEGLPRGVDLYEYFGLEPFRLSLVGINTVLEPPFEEKILEENEEFVVKINAHGVTEKNFKDGSSMPEFIDYPIKDPSAISWLKEKFDPATPGRVDDDWLAKANRKRQQGHIIGSNGGMYFGFLNEHVGTEKLLYMYYDSPEFIHQVNELQCALCEMALELVGPSFALDFLGYHEDMAYKNGSIISPAMFKEFMTPYYRRIQKLSAQYKVDIQYMDSDGDINQLIPLWIDCGIKLMSPLEVAAGMDVVALRKTYGKDLCMIGGFDKRILAAGKAQITAELERMRHVIEEGGFIPVCDHGIPPDVSFENISCFVDCLKTFYGVN